MCFRNFAIIPLHPRCFVPSLVAICPAVLEKMFKCCQYVFSLLCIYLPKKQRGPSFEKKIITQGCFVPGLVEIDLAVLEKLITYFRYYLPLEKGTALYLKTWTPWFICSCCSEPHVLHVTLHRFYCCLWWMVSFLSHVVGDVSPMLKEFYFSWGGEGGGLNFDNRCFWRT